MSAGAAIGEGSRVGGTLDAVNPQLITIGRYCVVGSGSALLTHCPIRGARPVVLGDYVWVGFGAIVLPGVMIGSRCVIGAGAVVTRDVPAGSVVAGVPARVLRQLTEEESDRLVINLRSGGPIAKV